MKKIQFNLNEKPTYVTEHVAYLVTIENVNLMRQYIEKFCEQSVGGYLWIPWFDNVIGNKIKKNPSNMYYLYFKKEHALGWDEFDNGVAKRHHYDIYHVVPNSPIIME